MRRTLLVLSTALAALGASSLLFVGGSNVAQAAEVPLDPEIKPDAVLNPGQTAVFKHTTPLLGGSSFYSPSECRGDAPLDPTAPDVLTAPLVCKAYRIVINIDPDPKANNVVLLTAEFDQVQAPSLAVVAAGLNPPPLNGIDVYVWDYEDHYLGQNAPGILDPVAGPGDPDDVPPGSAGFASPERGGFKVKQRVYDITVNGETGVNREFTLRVTYSNEIFKSPEELLDDPSAFDGSASGDPNGPTDFFGRPLEPSGQDGASFDLPQADVAPDSDLAGVGLGVSESFDPEQGISLGNGSARSISANAKAPSALTLLLGMVLLPLGLSAAVVVVVRRRQRALVS